MKRRDALARVAFMMGGTLSAPTVLAFLEGCTTATETATGSSFAFSEEQLTLVSEVAELIIPKTDTPGAKDAKVGEFIQLMLRDCYKPEDQKSFNEGIARLEKEGFLKSSEAEQTALLTALEKDAKEISAQVTEERNKAKEAKKDFQEPGVPFFRLMKELTLLGYFTSEVGATQALEYLPIPGKYEGCVDLTPEQKAWAI
jgi:hypothetical protein